ncbi:hypothetical protein CHLRE_17g711457v5 [Chlamydomonas reinhardtii]|uniref:Uncharacterized protein n=1 Tax=Chlamydomonas reinhardtii TaxID=3055 RepID=A0A2K3CPP2_CHLRE|nr:uncharacterized protein CHLRE_17g711457v5 [Chlamydomonas reinhardtii]PNW70236.1 hypothetical protein CHLRE_17g711457v5 [Chlamydomonas reinhardtii]
MESNIMKLTDGAFSLSAARELASKLAGFANESSSPPQRDAVLASVDLFQEQLNKLEALRNRQDALAVELSLNGAETTSSEAAAGTALASPGPAEAQTQKDAADAAASAMPDVFSVSDQVLDREHVRALAWAAACPQEAVRKEARAFTKAISDRLSLASKRTKGPERDRAPMLAGGHGGDVRAGGAPAPFNPAAAARPGHGMHAGAAAGAGPGAAAVAHAASGGPGAGRWGTDAGGAAGGSWFVFDDAEEAARAAQLAKIGSLLLPDTGGIAGVPISVVNIFQQQMAACGDWRVRRAALEALRRTALDVLWRLLQNSRVLDCLAAWLQDALWDGQATMLRLLLDVMAGLPMRRDLLKGSKLEAVLEGLSAPLGWELKGLKAGGVTGAAAAAEEPGSVVGLQRRFGGAAAAVLGEWRKDPDAATILRRSGSTAVPDAPPGAPVPGSRLLGAAAPAELQRLSKRPMPLAGTTAAAAAAAAGAGGGLGPVPGLGAAGSRLLAPGDTRGGPRQRTVQELPLPPLAAAAGAGGGGGALRRAAGGVGVGVSGPAVKDMTAKLGETGRVDTDVVLGFRSRVGDGAVRRSQISMGQPRAGAGAGAVGGAAGTGRLGGGGGMGALGSGTSSGSLDGVALPGVLSGLTLPAGLGAVLGGESGGGGGGGEVDEQELNAAAVARLRAEREAQRQVAALVAEARRQVEVAVAEKAFRERAESHRLAVSRRAAEELQKTQEKQQAAAKAVADMRETVAWGSGPPLLVMTSTPEPAKGEESVDKTERTRVRRQTTKVVYRTRDLVPDTPGEPKDSGGGKDGGGSSPAAKASAAVGARPFPWLPVAEAGDTDGRMDWWRQNLVLWELGVRLADYVLPPALLHKHLGLDAELLPPQYAGPPAPPPLAMLRQLQATAAVAAPQPTANAVAAAPLPPSAALPDAPRRAASPDGWRGGRPAAAAAAAGDLAHNNHNHYHHQQQQQQQPVLSAAYGQGVGGGGAAVVLLPLGPQGSHAPLHSGRAGGAPAYVDHGPPPQYAAPQERLPQPPPAAAAHSPYASHGYSVEAPAPPQQQQYHSRYEPSPAQQPHPSSRPYDYDYGGGGGGGYSVNGNGYPAPRERGGGGYAHSPPPPALTPAHGYPPPLASQPPPQTHVRMDSHLRAAPPPPQHQPHHQGYYDAYDDRYGGGGSAERYDRGGEYRGAGRPPPPADAGWGAYQGRPGGGGGGGYGRGGYRR